MGSGTLILLVKAVELLSLGLTVAPAVQAEFNKSMGVLNRAIAEGRDPTPEEVAEVDKAIDLLRSEFHKTIAVTE